MPMHDARAIANEFLKLKDGAANQMWLQKMVYIAHGWNLAINDEPLVEDRIEAWDGGPVLRIIWNHIRDWGHNAKGGLLGRRGGKAFSAELTDQERAIIHHVWKRYGSYSGRELSQLTHQAGTPWSNAYFGHGKNAALSNQDIKQHFTELALAGRS